MIESIEPRLCSIGIAITASQAAYVGISIQNKDSHDMPGNRKEAQPNILKITCHDLGQHIGCYGIPTVRTPNIDRIAETGIRFENSFCVAPQCSPSRASMVTGRYPHNNGVMGLTHGDFAWDLNRNERHLAGLLSDAGWRSVLVGLQHETQDPERMFDEIVTTSDQCEIVADHAAAFLDNRRDANQPFYIQLGFTEPHREPRSSSGFGKMPSDHSEKATFPEYLVDEPDAQDEMMAFEGAIHRVDTAIGHVLEALDEASRTEETLILMTTDHGIPFPRAKCSPYDPGIETCFIIRWPGGPLPRGKTYDEMISNIDLLPTVLDLVDHPIPETIQGLSFAPLLTDSGSYQTRTKIFGEMTYHDYCDPRRWIRTNKYKLIINFTTSPFFMNPSQTWRPKAVSRDPPDPALEYHKPVELYDLDEDPMETNNLAEHSEYEPIRRDMLTRLHRWMKETEDPLLNGIPAPPMHERALSTLRNERK